MRYLSLFAGIEAATVAVEPLGWTPVAYVENDPFCRAVLHHHYPQIPNLGDITTITEATLAALGPIDLIIGGFPCQDVSVAGQRKGLHHADGTPTRSGLFFTAMQLVAWARAHNGCRWVLLENVPGLLSSRRGRDFAAVVGALAGAEFTVPRSGWGSTGVCLGPAGLIEWRVLDAEWFGVPQRRHRVFALADFGDWAARPPLLVDAYSLSGHPAPRREAREDVAACPAQGADREGTDGDARRRRDDDVNLMAFVDVAPTMKARSQHGGGLGADFECDGGLALSYADQQERQSIDTTLDACGKDGSIRHQAEGRVQGYRITGNQGAFEVGDTMPTYTNSKDPSQFVVFDPTQVTSKANRSNPQPGDPCHPLASQAHPPAIAFADQRGRQNGDTSLVETAHTLHAMKGPSESQVVAYGGNNTSGPLDVATACNAHGGTGRLDFESETFIAYSESGQGWWREGVGAMRES